ncbi:hypothetical protein DYY66_0234 [Candidatus Nitrosotalea sp. FS]|nr:hypothetical protein [Candidatus Nitrosotalea sp. FS]
MILLVVSTMKEFDRVLCSCTSCRCGHYGKGSIDNYMCDNCKNDIHSGMRPVTKATKSH